MSNFNKSQIMKNAWKAANVAAKKFSEHKKFMFGRQILVNEGIFYSASDFIAETLKQAWDAAKNFSVTVRDYAAETKAYLSPLIVTQDTLTNYDVIEG